MNYIAQVISKLMAEDFSDMHHYALVAMVTGDMNIEFQPESHA